jgi:hypothetical protein
MNNASFVLVFGQMNETGGTPLTVRLDSYGFFSRYWYPLFVLNSNLANQCMYGILVFSLSIIFFVCFVKLSFRKLD